MSWYGWYIYLCVYFTYLFLITHPNYFNAHIIEYLPVAWIGNVLAISTLQSTLGGTILVVKAIFVPFLPVCLCSWGVATLLGMLSTKVYSILLPFVAMAGGFTIILCPWPFLTVKNMMLLIFYLIVAAPLSLRYSGRFDNNDYVPQQDLGHFFVPGLIGTCLVGAFVALLVHLITLPTPKSTTCTRQSKSTIKQLSYETHKLLQSIVEYTNHIGKSSARARQARTLIEFYVNRRQQTLAKLEGQLPAMKAEKQMTKSELDTLEVFLSCSKKQQTHAELIKLATTQMYLGEEFTSQNDTGNADLGLPLFDCFANHMY